MISPFRSHILLIGAVAAALLTTPAFADRTPSSPSPSSQDGMTILGRGPLHEAFGQPVSTNPQPGPTAQKTPPDPIAEEPPEQKPAGDNVQWIPGYWSWDLDKKDWIWVSGMWRNEPPGRKWVPGHWSKTEAGWQWAPGFWAPATESQIEYSPQPPDSLDAGPSSPAPDDDSLYVPGLWIPHDDSFAWRPGYWLDCRPNWIWNAAHYAWSPNGYVYVSGYWDYPFANRGLLFAPVYFNQPLWLSPTWYYRPGFVIRLDGIFASLFVRPSYCSYYFGDYYDPYYLRFGFSPWFSFGLRNWDPCFGYYRWNFRNDPGWYSGLRNQYWAFRSGQAVRPPLTVGAPGAVINNTTVRSPGLVTPLASLGSKANLKPLTSTQLANQRTQIKQTRDLGIQRTQIERTTTSLTSKSLKLPWAPPTSVAPANAASAHGSTVSPGVSVLRSGAPVISGTSPSTTRSVSPGVHIIQSGATSPGSQSPRILSNPRNSSTPQILSRPVAPSISPPPAHYSAPRSNYAPSPSHGSGGGHGGAFGGSHFSSGSSGHISSGPSHSSSGGGNNSSGHHK